MPNTTLTEDQVKKALQIESFRNLSKEKVMKFVSLIPSMDKEVALSIINQFPEYAGMARSMVEEMGAICDNALKENTHSQDAVFAAYRKIIDDLGELLKKDDISSEEREYISSKMIEVADKMAAKDSENKKFQSWIVRNKEYIITGVLLLGSAILGVTIYNNNDNLPWK